MFANTRIGEENVVTQTGRWLRNSSILEYVGTEGSFRNTTVLGQINGQGLDLGVVDDPIKGRAEAQSKATRDKTWSWFTDDFFGRFSDHAGFCMIMTRWHLDDPVGRWLEHFPNTKVLRYPAIAEEDEKYRKKGEPLFPEMKPLSFLNERRKVLTQASWESLYQQRPIAAGGDMFPVERFKVITSVDRSNIKRSVRYVDKAGTEDGGDYTAAVLVHDMKDGTTVVEDVLRGQWGALEREARLMQCANADMAVLSALSGLGRARARIRRQGVSGEHHPHDEGLRCSRRQGDRREDGPSRTLCRTGTSWSGIHQGCGLEQAVPRRA